MQKTKAKHNQRPRALFRVVLTLITGVLFALWMPFIIVTSNGIHWLTYFIYWGAAWAWLIPFMRWMRHNKYRSFRRRITTFVVLLVLWVYVNMIGMFAAGHFMLPLGQQHNCTVGRHRHYECYLWEIEIPSGDTIYPGFFMRISAIQIGKSPIAHVTNISQGVYSANEGMTP